MGKVSPGTRCGTKSETYPTVTCEPARTPQEAKRKYEYRPSSLWRDGCAGNTRDDRRSSPKHETGKEHGQREVHGLFDFRVAGDERTNQQVADRCRCEPNKEARGD